MTSYVKRYRCSLTACRSYATASGFASSDITAWVEAPKDMPLTNPGLEIVVGPTVERSLVDIVLAPALPCQIEANRIASAVESTTSDLLASIGLQELLAASRHGGGPTLQAIDQRIRAAISGLVASQNDDGGWSWSGQAGTSDRYASARVVWALALARKAAYRVADDTFDKAVTYLDSQIAATDANDYESKAILLHALTMAGREDFTLANRIYRSRPVLSPAALAYTALTFAHMGRTGTAKELLDAFAEKDLNQPADRRTHADRLSALEQQSRGAASAVRAGAGAGRAGLAAHARDGRLVDGSSHGPSLAARQGNRPGRAGVESLVGRKSVSRARTIG